MSEREAWRARLRERFREKAARPEPASAEPDGETAALIQTSAARPRSGNRSYDDLGNWQGKAAKGAAATNAARRTRAEDDYRLTAADGTRAYHQRLHEDLVARGEKACKGCGITYPLSGFLERRLPSGRPGWHPYCDGCRRANERERYRATKGDAA